jgi:predicted DNA binding CopG/RHH family protein
MKKKIEYSDLPPGDEPIGELVRVKDFLPPPEELVFKEKNTKVTIALSQTSVEFFKREAKKHHTQYQKMIRNLLDEYVARHNQ